MTVSTALHVAVLINGKSQYRERVKASFTSAVTTGSPNAEVDFYDPIDAQIYPDPSKYDLIVLSGGTVDPMSKEPWVVKMQEFLRTTVREHPRQKLMGICWGHQTIAVAFGGIVGGIDKAEIGVHAIPLTPAGSAFFISLPSPDHFNIHEYHRREVKTPGKGFIALAEGNQAFINADNTIITLQGHPELDEALAKAMLVNAPSYMAVEGAEKEAIAKKMESPHNGLDIWRRVIEWVKE